MAVALSSGITIPCRYCGHQSKLKLLASQAKRYDQKRPVRTADSFITKRHNGDGLENIHSKGEVLPLAS